MPRRKHEEDDENEALPDPFEPYDETDPDVEDDRPMLPSLLDDPDEVDEEGELEDPPEDEEDA